MLGAVFALLLATASPAPSVCAATYAPLTDASVHLQAAQDAIDANHPAIARAQHDAVMAILGPLPWLPAETSCDPKKFALTKMSLMSRSLVVAVKDGSMTPDDARAKNDEMWEGMLPGAQVAEVAFNYPDLFKAIMAPKTQLDDLWRAEQIEWHTPSGPNCAHPNLDPIAYDSGSDANAAMETMSAGTSFSGSKETKVLVKLDETGKIVDAYVFQSSGDPRWDRTILNEARAAKFLPKIENCKPVASTYTYSSGVYHG